MGLFDRFRRKPGESEGDEKSFFLDADKSSSLGDVDFMRRSNTIRHTFPGTVNNPGMKERFEDVASMEAQMGKVSDGLPESSGGQSVARVDPGVPKPVKKTFAQPMSQQQLQDRQLLKALFHLVIVYLLAHRLFECFYNLGKSNRGKKLKIYY